jgi:hypothetical protein
VLRDAEDRKIGPGERREVTAPQNQDAERCEGMPMAWDEKQSPQLLGVPVVVDLVLGRGARAGIIH